MDKKQQRQLIPIIQKISLFNGLTVEEVKRILEVSRVQEYRAGEEVFQLGGPSHEMLILLQGELLATSKSGATLGEIAPGTSTGEMGVFTGKPRSARVVASKNSTVLTLRKHDLGRIFKEDPRFEVKVLKNLIVLLSERLADSNRHVESYDDAATGTKAEEEIEFIHVSEGSLR